MVKEYKRRMEEAKRRDHRVLGKKLDLFSLQEDAGGGLVSSNLCPFGDDTSSVVGGHIRQRSGLKLPWLSLFVTVNSLPSCQAKVTIPTDFFHVRNENSGSPFVAAPFGARPD